MTIHLKIPRALYTSIRADLVRPHSFAAERVGFARARLGTGEGDNRLVLLTGYTPVADTNYIDDPKSGARIDATAIREAMQTILEEEVGLFHVHLHDFPGVPGLGRMDQREIPELIKTFRATGPKYPHGILLLSSDSLSSWVWLPGKSEAAVPARTTVVGMPLYVRPPTDDR